MRSKHFVVLATAVTVLLLSSTAIFAQLGQLRGHVVFKQADGTTTRPTGAMIDVYRMDLAGDYHTTTDKRGEFQFAGLPYVGTYTIAVSLPDALAAYQGNVKVGQEIDYEIPLGPGNGHRLTRDEVKQLVAKASAGSAGGAGGGSSSGGESASDKAKRDEMLKKNKEIEEKNKKIEGSNKIVNETFTAGNAALLAKNYDEAVKQYDVGLAADPDQAALLTNKALALKARGVERYNAGIQSKDEATKTAGIESAKTDFHDAVDTANKAVEIVNKETPGADPADQQRHNANKYMALNTRAEAMRLFVTKGDPSQADAGIVMYQEYMAAETDPAKKARAQMDLAQMLLDAGAGDKAFLEFQKVLVDKPDDPDANLGAGLALFSGGDKAKYQEAANYLQHFVDKAPDDHKYKADARAILAELKSTENVVPEKTTPAKRRRP
jgi:tetratricopeptide (TPR) repeat protein